MSFITNQWVKMNPTEAATRLVELERENAALRAGSKQLADHLEELLRMHCLTLRCETGHPCPENIVTFVPMRAAINAARAKKGGAT